MKAMWSLMLAAALMGCSGGPAQPEAKPKQDKSSCDLTLDNLDGKQFLMQNKLTSGAVEEDLLARVRFSKSGDTIKAKYTTRSLADVYEYTCAVQGNELNCWQDDVKAETFCRALIANGKECTPDGVAQLTGLKVDAIGAAIEETKKAVAAMAPKDRSEMMSLYSSANKPLRGVLHIRIKKDICGLSFSDMYQYMSNGTLKEIENVVGTKPFVATDKTLVWENCTDGNNLVFLETPDAKAEPGQTLTEGKIGQVLPVRFVGPEHAKAEPGCTYAMDTWGGYEPVDRHKALAPAEDGALDWSFNHTFMKEGPGVVHMYRYRTCEGKSEELLGVSCRVIKVR